MDERSSLAAMGEKTTVDLTPAAVRQIAKVLDTAADRLADKLATAIGTPVAAELPADPCPGMHGEPWTRYDGDDLVAFADDRLVLRWINAGQVSDVPAAWRPLLLGPAVVKR